MDFQICFSTLQPPCHASSGHRYRSIQRWNNWAIWKSSYAKSDSTILIGASLGAHRSVYITTSFVAMECSPTSLNSRLGGATIANYCTYIRIMFQWCRHPECFIERRLWNWTNKTCTDQKIHGHHQAHIGIW